MEVVAALGRHHGELVVAVGGDGALAALDGAAPQHLDAAHHVVVVREAAHHQHGRVAVRAQHLAEQRN